MSPLVQAAGALAASAVAWAAITLFALGPRDRLRPGPLRWLGGAALVALALIVAGMPVPVWVPLALVVAGLVGAVWPGRAADR